MGYFFAFIALFIGVVIWIFNRVFKGTKKARKNEEIFRDNLAEKGLVPDQIIFTSHANSENCLSVNQAKSKISFGSINNNQHLITNYDFSSIVAFEIQIDGRKVRKIEVGGVLAGAALEGGLATLISNQSGLEKMKINNIRLLITIENASNSLIKFSLLEPTSHGKGWDSDSFIVQYAIENAEEWSGIFNVILKRKEEN